MNVSTITMDPTEARKQLREYEQGLRKRYDAEHAQIRDALSALAKGEKVIDVSEAIRTTEFDAKGRPMLAIARADRRQVRFFRPRWESVGVFDASAERATMTTDTLERRVSFNQRNESGDDCRGFALVPLVPPAGLRVIGGASQLRHHFILWEVERWADRRIGATPDVDPYLLRHIAGDLYAVVFEWELTPLERAVMAGRRNG